MVRPDRAGSCGPHGSVGKSRPRMDEKGDFAMMTWIFSGMVILATLTGLATGRIEAVSNAALEGAAEAVTLSISLLGALCLWNGIMRVGEAAGLTARLSRLFRPLLRLLFGRELDPDGPAARAITLNLSANLLGLGNAATPFGLAAMKELDRLNPHPETASRAMVMFVVLNTASIELIPATAIALRQQNGSAAPAEILPAVWIVSLLSASAALVAARLLTARDPRRRAGRR